MLPLPLPDDKGRRVILTRTGGYDPQEVKIVDVLKVQMMIADVLLEEDDRVAISGTVDVMDHSKATLAHMAQFSPSIAKKASTLLQVNVAESTQPLSLFCYICFKYL
jgi:hypothetical protein